MVFKYFLQLKSSRVLSIQIKNLSRLPYSIKINKRSLLLNLKNQPNNFRFINTKTPSSSKTLPLVVGFAAISGIIGAYTYFNTDKTDKEIPEKDEIDEVPFVNDSLDEDLALLKEYGRIPYLLIGAGSAAFAAYRAIRTLDPNAKIIMIGDEPYHPYMRPPLSKEVWFDSKQNTAETLSFTTWDGKTRSLLFEPPEYYFSVKEILDNKNGGVAVIRGAKVVKIDPFTQIVYLENGKKVEYEKCLIATGSKPKNIPIFKNGDDSIKKHVTLFKTIQDFKKLDKLCKNIETIVIVGGGFLGSELACGISRTRGTNGLKVIQIFPETGNMGKIFPEYLSNWTSKKLTDDGIKVIPNVTIESVNREENKLNLLLSNGDSIKTDHVIVTVGSEANTDIAKSSGLEVDKNVGGFVVNTEMEARKNLWVAGDASCFYDVILGRRRVEHHDHATVSGQLAGKNMAGAGLPYQHQSMFWSDLGPDIGYEAIGIIDSELPTIGIFVKDSKTGNAVTDKENSVQDTDIENKSQPLEDEGLRVPNQADNYNKGIIFYLRNNIIVGIILWNVFTKMSIARKIINESKSFDDIIEVAKLFELNSPEE